MDNSSEPKAISNANTNFFSRYGWELVSDSGVSVVENLEETGVITYTAQEYATILQVSAYPAICILSAAKRVVRSRLDELSLSVLLSITNNDTYFAEEPVVRRHIEGLLAVEVTRNIIEALGTATVLSNDATINGHPLHEFQIPPSATLKQVERLASSLPVCDPTSTLAQNSPHDPQSATRGVLHHDGVARDPPSVSRRILDNSGFRRDASSATRGTFPDGGSMRDAQSTTRRYFDDNGFVGDVQSTTRGNFTVGGLERDAQSTTRRVFDDSGFMKDPQSITRKVNYNDDRIEDGQSVTRYACNDIEGCRRLVSRSWMQVDQEMSGGFLDREL